MSDLRAADEEEREDQGRQTAMAVQGVRKLGHALDQHRRARPQGLPLMALVQRGTGRHAGPGPHLQEAHLEVLGDLADARGDRRGPQGRLRRRHLPGEERVRAHRVQRRARARLVPVPGRDGARLEGAHGLRRAARGRGDRRRQRLREGVQGGLAGHAGAEVRVPRLLPVKRYTTSRPNLQAGVELYALARELLHLETLAQAQWWRERFVQWCGFWCDFLEERSTVDGRSVYTHERLRKARSGLVALSNQGTLFTYLDPALSAERPLPATNNRIEGGVNAPLRSMLRNRRGMSVARRIKAVFWWCYMRTEYRLPASQILARMPTDDDVDMLYELYGSAVRPDDGAPQWGDGLVWNEFHHATAYPYAVD